MVLVKNATGSAATSLKQHYGLTVEFLRGNEQFV